MSDPLTDLLDDYDRQAGTMTYHYPPDERLRQIINQAANKVRRKVRADKLEQLEKKVRQYEQDYHKLSQENAELKRRLAMVDLSPVECFEAIETVINNYQRKLISHRIAIHVTSATTAPEDGTK